MNTKMMGCALVIMVLFAMTCNGRYMDEDSEERSLQNRRNVLFEKLFERAFEQRVIFSFFN
jgi:hypothetical protein